MPLSLEMLLIALEAAPYGIEELRATVNAELCVYVPHVGSDGVQTHRELARDTRRREPSEQVPEHDALGIGQPRTLKRLVEEPSSAPRKR